jgi:uncharacterized membrane protein
MWGLVLFVVGIFYGWLSPGRQNKSQLFKQGILIGLVLAIAFAVIGYLFHSNPLGVGTGFVAFMISALILSLLFVLGVWLGDLIEGAGRRRTA